MQVKNNYEIKNEIALKRSAMYVVKQSENTNIPEPSFYYLFTWHHKLRWKKWHFNMRIVCNPFFFFFSKIQTQTVVPIV